MYVLLVTKGLSHMCHRQPSELCTIPTSIPLWIMDCHFGGHSSDSAKIFRLQKIIIIIIILIRIMLGCRSRDSCSNLFVKLKILPFPLQYIFSFLLFVIKNRNQYTVNSKIQHINTTQHSNFQQLWPSFNNIRKELTI
jgi:hypothetical protein